MVTAAQHLAQSEWLTLVLAMLNVAQVVWLADISARSRRVRRADHPSPPRQRRG